MNFVVKFLYRASAKLFKSFVIIVRILSPFISLLITDASLNNKADTSAIFIATYLHHLLTWLISNYFLTSFT